MNDLGGLLKCAMPMAEKVDIKVGDQNWVALAKLLIYLDKKEKEEDANRNQKTTG